MVVSGIRRRMVHMRRLPSRSLSLILALVVAAAVVTATPRAARAANTIIKQNESHSMWDLAILGHFMYLGGAGVGLRLGIPVSKTGVAALNDQIKIELGVSFRYWWPRLYYYDRDHPLYDDYRGGFGGVSIPLLFRWDFFLLEKLTLYFTLGIEINLIFEHWYWDHHYRSFWWNPVVPSMSFGALVNFHERVSLRVELATSGFNLGIEFRL
jgi:hypothetical protein